MLERNPQKNTAKKMTWKITKCIENLLIYKRKGKITK